MQLLQFFQLLFTSTINLYNSSFFLCFITIGLMITTFNLILIFIAMFKRGYN